MRSHQKRKSCTLHNRQLRGRKKERKKQHAQKERRTHAKTKPSTTTKTAKHTQSTHKKTNSFRFSRPPKTILFSLLFLLYIYSFLPSLKQFSFHFSYIFGAFAPIPFFFFLKNPFSFEYSYKAYSSPERESRKKNKGAGHTGIPVSSKFSLLKH